MHIPDGFITAPVATAGCVVAAGCVAYTMRAPNTIKGRENDNLKAKKL